jgi:hypothetical protein
MRIERDQIRISGRISNPDIFKNLSHGGRLSAIISERLGQRHAILNIGGNLIRAEFMKGVPNTGNILLTLEKKSGNTFLFRITNPHEEIVKQELLEFTAINKNELTGSIIYDLKMYIKQGANSIFALNSELLKIKKNNYNKIIDLLNKLLLKGLKYENLFAAASLLNTGNSRILQQFYYIFSQLMPGAYKHFFKSDEKISEQISEFAGQIDKLLTKEEIDETIKLILELLSKSPKDTDKYGEIVFFDENKFKSCKYIYNKNIIFVSIDLSGLGLLEIIIKNEDEYNSAVFFCENNESLAALKEEAASLQSAMKRYGRKEFHVSFYNNKKAIEKIIEIISSIDINYLIDAKV